jgi:hypothetical protein
MKTRTSIKREPRRVSLRDASRRALESIRDQVKEDRRMKRILRDIEPDVAVGEPTCA